MVFKTRLRRFVLHALSVLLLFAIFGAVLALGMAVWPVEGDSRLSDGTMVVDNSHSDEGYILVRGPESSSRLKLRMSLGEQSYTYDLNNLGQYEVFPVQMGSGEYACTLYRNVSGSKYSQEGKVNLSVELADETAAFLCPNQYVWYTEMTPAVLKSEELCAGLTSDADCFAAIRSFVEENFSYDFDKARSVQPGLLPEIDDCFERKMGICQDLAAMTASMLRVQGIPSKLVIGYVGSYYHAWTQVRIGEEWVHYDPTLALGGIPDSLPYTAERYY